MRHLHEEIQQHIHDKLCQEVNEFVIRLKIHKADISKETPIQKDKILEARKRHPEPTAEETIELLERIRDEMNECKMPYRRF